MIAIVIFVLLCRQCEIAIAIAIPRPQFIAIIKNIASSTKLRSMEREVLERKWKAAKTKSIEAFEDLVKHLSSKLVQNPLKNSDSGGETEEDKEFLKLIDRDNNIALNILMDLLESKSGWNYVTTRDGVLVERRFLVAGPFVSKIDASKGSKHACVKSSGIIDARPEDVFRLFTESERTTEYNELASSNVDVYSFSKNSLSLTKQWSKISYATSPRLGPFKARDFSSVVNFRENSDKSFIILNRPAYISKTAPNSKYVRATILLAGNVIQPHGNDKTLLTLIAHVNPGGGADTQAAAWMINKLCAVSPPAFIRKVEKAANRYRVAS